MLGQFCNQPVIRQSGDTDEESNHCRGDDTEESNLQRIQLSDEECAGIRGVAAILD